MSSRASLQTSLNSSPCFISRASFDGWDSIRLGNGIIELFIVPQIGGRIIQLRLGEEDLFYVNSRHAGRVYRPEENDFVAGWKNYGGSKVWPAPQGWSSNRQWPGPPDPVLDGGFYHSRIVEENPDTAAVYLESLHDEYTGLTFAREIRVFRDSSAVQVRHEMRNTSSRPVRWAVWQVTQQAAKGGLSVFVPAKTYRQIYGDECYASIQLASESNLWRLRYSDQVAKFALIPEEGWIAALDSERGMALLEAFPLFKSLPYPDDAPLELLVNGKGSYTIHDDQIDTTADPNGCDPFIETEILSPFVELEPDQQYTFEIFWHCASLEGDEVKRASCQGIIARPLTLARQDKKLKVTGAYGFFTLGHLEIVTTYRDGREGTSRTLQSVSPLEACSVEECIPYEDRMSKVSLRLRDLEGKLLGTVDEVAL